ncbi:peroxiredoxin [Rummeliibacillus sp. G93]|uniref:Thioredoxin n=1 Tax=Rummeliibacillus stabekisii TaxID=241244 RepID=A0A143H9S3_9BACL|nr:MULTISPECIES: peroxiredoxin [Rummeliibacillus]AMW98276.1 thioredoxin [Rummeliibacillus stabekisii]MBB5170034.1 alkyl hydroperoxide reductase subunit AhpC [Rummeliibacillus stabekisii]MCM3315663.1 peroxiredoxin [Rummeliibacillus stabekisii]UQW98236.1 peroxiredoxin [Rummeliibacillus sp. G93]GEL04292.1 thioredoxin-like protein YkuU [Rummeliibacillus stabekisii]
MAERMVAKQAPVFEMQAVMPNKEFGTVSLEENMKNDKWTVLFFYPMDFTFVCPTEITSMSDRYDEFEDLDAEVIGVSTDTVHTHLAWINTDRSQNGIGELKFPLAADHNQRVSRDYGVLIEDEGVALRGLYIINPEGELQYQVVNHNNIGRDVDETLRVLQALQTGGLCPANWRPGDATLKG